MPPIAFAPSPSCALSSRASASTPAICLRQLLLAAAAVLSSRAAHISPAAASPDIDDGYVRADSGLEVRDYRLGGGRAVAVGDVVVVRWTGRLSDRFGWTFQREDADEVSLKIGAGDDLIRGFREGLAGDGATIPPMMEGGKRRIVIPKGAFFTFHFPRPASASVASDWLYFFL